MKTYIKLACMVTGIGMLLSSQLMAQSTAPEPDCSKLDTGQCHQCCVGNFKACKNACTGDDWKECKKACKTSFKTCQQSCNK